MRKLNLLLAIEELDETISTDANNTTPADQFTDSNLSGTTELETTVPVGTDEEQTNDQEEIIKDADALDQIAEILSKTESNNDADKTIEIAEMVSESIKERWKLSEYLIPAFESFGVKHTQKQATSIALTCIRNRSNELKKKIK